MALTQNVIDWSKILIDAVTVPGKISSAYRLFHGFSLRNQILALIQCDERGIEPGPLATYDRWRGLGRQVRRGEKALTLCVPLTRKVGDDAGERRIVCGFTYRNRWFVLAQTEGEPIAPEPTPGWDRTRALAVLGISEVPFDETDGNVMGFARRRTFAINPVNPHPAKTMFHELGHVVLGHTETDDLVDAAALSRSAREVEAECVALVCVEALGLPHAELCRGYIQSWIRSDTITEEMAGRIFGAADRILEAGRSADERTAGVN